MRFNDLENSTKIILKVVFVVLALGFLWVIRDIIVLVLLAIVLASAMEPLADYLHARKIPRGVSVIAVYVVFLGLAALVISSIIPPVIDQFKLLASNLPEYAEDLQANYPNLANLMGVDNLSNLAGDIVTGGGEESVVSRTVGVFNGFFAFITVLVISFYLVVSKEKGMKDFISSIVPVRRRDQVVGLVTKVQKKMGLWVLGQVILSLVIFVFTFIGLTILGVKYALVLALLAGLLEVIPYIGPTLSAVPAFFFALVQSPALAVGVIILYILIQKAESYVIVPKVMEKTIGTSPLVVLIALLVGFKLAGVLGLLLAVPLAGAIEEFSGDSGRSESAA
jgi:predicted PurR-regulated permease PerM